MLDRCLESIFSIDIHDTVDKEDKEDKVSIQITIINNHSNFVSRFSHHPLVTILHNMTRPDWSTGHLARSWNQCILHGFKDLNNPDCDVLVLAQNDVVFTPSFLKECLFHLQTFTFITQGAGDELQIMTPACIKTLGLYDERFCNIGYQEADYFLRALLFNPQLSSINDTHHGRLLNPIQNNMIKCVINGGSRNEPSHLRSLTYHPISYSLFKTKWNTEPDKWNDDTHQINCLSKQYIYYPYFEASFVSHWHDWYFIYW